jgi:DNA-binding PadR family transcriptional regulator
MPSRELVAASATPLVLTLLSQGESYGYELVTRVRELSGGRLEWSEGMLYPILHRLERDKLIRATWRTVDGRERKYYAATPRGRTHLAQQKREWSQVAATLFGLWKEDPCGA